MNNIIEGVNDKFKGCDDYITKTIKCDGKSLTISYIDGLANVEIINESVIKTYFKEGIISSADYKMASTVSELTDAILRGDTVLVDNNEATYVVGTKRPPSRGVSDNDVEKGIRGPRDSFSESIRLNTALIRKRIRDDNLKLTQGVAGERSKTDYAIMYIDGLCSVSLVEEIKNLMNEYIIDGIFDIGMMEHLIDSDSIFPKYQTTTRPDKVASGIMEGRVAIVLDNSPEVLLAPCNINMMFQGSDDYYNPWIVGSFSRIVRYFAAFLSILLPGLYVAVTTYHSEMLPSKFVFAIASARSTVTLPIIYEMVLTELMFELLREAGIRLPGTLGNTMGVVGGLIVGQAAVEAGLISTIVVIVVATGAIATFTIPNEIFSSIFRLIKFYVLFFSSVLGLFGFIMTFISIVVLFSKQESFGVPYLYPIVSHTNEIGKDDFILRSPILNMKTRPIWVKENRLRLRRRR